MTALNPISTLAPDGVKVILLRRTGNDTVKVSVGCRWADGKLHGWYGAREPTHWFSLTVLPLPSRGGKG